MKKGYYKAAIALFFVIFILSSPLQAGEFQYPYYLIGSHYIPVDYFADSNLSTSECWTGIGNGGNFPLSVDPNKYLVGPPPSVESSAVSLPTGSWIELLFQGVIFDGPGYDIFISEMDPMGEQALIFLTDGSGQEYLLEYVKVPNTAGHLPTILGLDLAGLAIPFEPCAIRVVGIDPLGGSPGFDLSFVNARIYQGDNEAARFPYPPNNAENVPIDAKLNWLPFSDEEKYNVYFGEDISDVYPDAETILNPIQPQSPNSFDPNTLELGKTYYWRVDHVNESDPNDILAGIPWSFSVSNNLIIDNFESYTSADIFRENWILEDYGYSVLVRDPNPTHSCHQAMELDYYYNQLNRTAVSYSFDSPQNWISAGVKTIELFFHGSKNNYNTCRMFIELSDGYNELKIPYNDDINDITKEAWQLWRIDLQSMDLLTENVSQINMHNIKYFSIGFEDDPNIPGDFGYGTVYFDDIILYPSRCLAENRPEADFNGDCIVNFLDYAELAYNWLNSGYNIYQVQEPNNDPVFWYEFENNLIDTIGNANGEISGGSPSFDSGILGKAISFNGVQDKIKVSHVYYYFSQIQKGMTIAFWQKGRDSLYDRDTIFCSEYEYNISDPAVSINLGCWNGTGIYNWDCGTHLPFDRRLTGKHRYKKEWVNQWNHWAFTKDIRTGVMQVFLNGVLINSRSDSSTFVSVFDSFTIGSGWYGSYDGFIDDMRIYDYALSQPEIAYIATDGTGVFNLPLMTPADLQPDNIIDFNDLIILANHWLDNFLFPGDN